jgi:integrase
MGRKSGFTRSRTSPATGRTTYTAYYLMGAGNRYISAGTFDNAQDADDAWMGKVTDMRRGAHADPRRGRTKFAEFAALFLVLSVSQGVNTVKNYRGVIRRELVPRFGQMRLDEITSEDITAWVAELNRRGREPATIRSYKALMSAIMGQAIRLRCGITGNPCAGVKTPKTPPQRIRAISQDDVANILKNLPGPVARMLVELDLQTGCRWGELTEFRGCDVMEDPDDEDRVYLNVERSVADVGAEDNPLGDGGRFFVQETTKGGSDRKIGLSVAMTDKLLAYMEECTIGPDDLLFPQSRLRTEHDKATAIPLTIIGEIPDDLGRTTPNRLGRTYQHGTMSAYTAGGCKCDWCRRAFARYRSRRRAAGKDPHPRKEGRKVGKNLTDHCTDDWFRRTVWKPALEAANIHRRIVFYDLRHTHATWLARSHKIDIDTLRRRMGHRRLETTQRYIHDADIVDTSAADVMDELMSSPTPRKRRRRPTAVA